MALSNELARHRAVAAATLLAPLQARAEGGALDALLSGATLVGFIAVVALVPAFVFYLRWHTLRRLQALMMAKSADAMANANAGADTAEPRQVAPLAQPVITVFDDLGQLPGATEAREQFVQRAVSQFRQALAIDAVVALGYAVLPWLFSGGAQASADAGAFGLMLGGFYLVLAAIRYLMFRTQFRAIDERSLAERVIMGIISFALSFVGTNVHPMTILKWFLAPRVQVFFVVGWMLMALSIGLGAKAPGVVAGVLLHAALAVWLARRLQRVPGKRLVVLRVFGMDNTSQFLFDGVLAFWKHFGHFFTVVDPAFWRHSHRVFSLGTLVFVALGIATISLGFLIYGLLPFNPHPDLAPLAAVLFAAPLFGGYAWFSNRQVDRTFIRSKEHLQTMLARFEKRPRNLDMTYKSLETRCYDNTWKVAVAEFARQSDAVVMDLRGFTPERSGCTFEVNYLLDAVPLERIVFVLDAASDHAAAAALILDAWKELDADSPNLAKQNPEIRFYIAAAQDGRDIQGVVDLLISAANSRAAAP